MINITILYISTIKQLLLHLTLRKRESYSCMIVILLSKCLKE